MGFMSELLKMAGENWDNLKYVSKHKYHVYKGGREIDLPRMQLIKHDMSKLSPAEWGPYKRFLFGEKTDESKKEFMGAVRSSHYKKNPHHREHWGDKGMPESYQMELAADWYSAGRTQGAHRFKTFRSWWKSNKDKVPIDAKTKSDIDARLKERDS